MWIPFQRLRIRDPESEAARGYRVEFPDLPGCGGTGATIEAAVGCEVLGDHIAVLQARGEARPTPSALDAMHRAGLVTSFLVPVPRLAEKTVRINITVPEGALRQIDAYVRPMASVARRSWCSPP